jgi:hypothetical protein
MSLTTAVLALLLYPLLYIFPFNLVGFRWGLRRGLAPMPAELQEKHASVERIIQTARHFLLLAAIALLIRGSTISLADVGFNSRNWRDSAPLGIFLGCLLAAFSIRLAQRRWLQASAQAGVAQPPIGIGVGIRLLSAVATIVWQAFCIVALTRVSFPTWVAVLLTGAAIGLLQFHASIGAAVGKAAGGAVFGFVFAATGSLVAPLAMAVIQIAGNLYVARATGSRAAAKLAPLRCPLCTAAVERHTGRDRGRIEYDCPNCHKPLKLSLPKWQAQAIMCSCMAASFAILLKSGVTFTWGYILFLPLTGALFLMAIVAQLIFAPGLQRLQAEEDPFRSTLFRS